MASGDSEIFISYAHADNEFPRYESHDWEGARGWVECFYHALRKRLQQLRRGTEIWRDGDGGIRGASALTPAIEDGIAKASILVTIHSPAYAVSEWCEKELRLFEKSAVARHGGLRAGNMLRVFKINKLPVTGASFVTRVPELADNTGYPFYRSVDGSPLEFEPLHGGEPGTKFLAAVNSVACDIVKVLQGHSAVVPPSGISVYLAETTPDVAGLRSKLQGELEQYGHSVLPLAREACGSDYVAKVRSDIRLARLSVHVIGGQAGPIPDASDGRSEAEVQYDVAGEEAAARPGFTRLTWLAPLAVPPEPAQATFRERLRGIDPALLVASLEDMRSLIKQQLGVKPEMPRPPTTGDVRIVYLMFDAPDEESAKPVATWLFDQGFEVLKPAHSGNLLKAHKVNLRDSHAALIYYGEVNEDWLAVKLGDLRKRLGEARGKTHKLRGAVYLADPADDAKSEFRSRLFDVIPGFGRFRPEMLEAFVDNVRGSGSP
jgi:hypothetical protein